MGKNGSRVTLIQMFFLPVQEETQQEHDLEMLMKTVEKSIEENTRKSLFVQETHSQRTLSN